MRVCAIVKYPPIQGGVSAYSHWLVHTLARAGHDVHVVTNADEVEPSYRVRFRPGDAEHLVAHYPGGGRVTLRSTVPWDAVRYHHIPDGNPSVTKLASLATETVRAHDCELLFAFYFEPYGVAAALASAWTGRPYVLKHAGSDRFALMSNPELSAAYREVVRGASALLSTGSDFAGFGVAPYQVFRAPPAYVDEGFSPDGPFLDLDAVARQLQAEDRTIPERSPDDSVLWDSPLAPGVPTWGAYGKFGELKGSFDLLQALALLRTRGEPGQLVLLGGGRHWPVVRRAIEELGLRDRVRRLPFLAPWHVPAFVRAVDAVAVLERDFTIQAHTPRIAAEVLACGTPLVCSTEIADKQTYLKLAENDPVIRVPDPTDPDALAQALRASVGPQALRMARAGTDAVPRLSRSEAAAAYEAIFQAALGSRRDGCVDARTPYSEPAESLEEHLRRRCPGSWHVLTRVGTDLSTVEPSTDSRSVTARAYDVVRVLGPLAGRLDEQVRAEELLLWLNLDVEGRAGVAAFPKPVVLGGPLTPISRPVAATWARTETFRLAVDEYAKRIDQRGPDSDDGPPVVTVADRPRAFVFHKTPSLVGRLYRVGDETAELLSLCDGSRMVEDLLDHADHTGRDRDRTRAALQHLLEADVVGLLRTPVSDERKDIRAQDTA